MPRCTIKQELKDVLHARKLATESKRKQRETKRLAKEKEAKRLALERAKISALIEKHKCHTLDLPDEETTTGTGKNSNNAKSEGLKRYDPYTKRHPM